MIDLGLVKDIEYFSIYPFFQTNIVNVDTFGGYKVINNVCYIFMIGICTKDTVINFPNSKDSLNNIYFQLNDTMKPFTTQFTLKKADYVKINVRYNL